VGFAPISETGNLKLEVGQRREVIPFGGGSVEENRWCVMKEPPISGDVKFVENMAIGRFRRHNEIERSPLQNANEGTWGAT
jgi:hypothetical protein